jgi:hypothetical protein
MKTKSEMQQTMVKVTLWELSKLNSPVAKQYPSDMTKGQMKAIEVEISEWELSKLQSR